MRNASRGAALLMAAGLSLGAQVDAQEPSPGDRDVGAQSIGDARGTRRAGGIRIYRGASGGPTTYCTGKTNTLGCTPFISTSGIPTVSDTDPFTIRSHNMRPGGHGVLLYGFQPDNLDFHGGKLCVKAPITRIVPPRIARPIDSGPCIGLLRRDFNRRIRAGADPLLTIGQTVFAQWRQRDPLDPAGFGDSLSDAVQFSVFP